MMQLTVVHQFLLPTMNPILLFIFTKLASILGLLGAIAIIILWLLLHGQHETSFILLCITSTLCRCLTILARNVMV